MDGVLEAEAIPDAADGPRSLPARRKSPPFPTESELREVATLLLRVTRRLLESDLDAEQRKSVEITRGAVLALVDRIGLRNVARREQSNSFKLSPLDYS